jgi:hypothetical protein
VPKPTDTQDTIAGFLRVEAGGGVLRNDQILWDVGIILHADAPNTQEAMAEQLMQEAIFWGMNAAGTSVVMSNGDQWYVTYTRCPGLSTRKADPMVAMTRYRAMIQWRMPGLAVPLGQQRVFSGRITLPPLPPLQAQRMNAPRPGRKTATPSGVPRPTRKGPPASAWG